MPDQNHTNRKAKISDWNFKIECTRFDRFVSTSTYRFQYNRSKAHKCSFRSVFEKNQKCRYIEKDTALQSRYKIRAFKYESNVTEPGLPTMSIPPKGPLNCRSRNSPAHQLLQSNGLFRCCTGVADDWGLTEIHVFITQNVFLPVVKGCCTNKLYKVLCDGVNCSPVWSEINKMATWEPVKFQCPLFSELLTSYWLRSLCIPFSGKQIIRQWRGARIAATGTILLAMLCTVNLCGCHYGNPVGNDQKFLQKVRCVMPHSATGLSIEGTVELLFVRKKRKAMSYQDVVTNSGR